MLPVDQHVHTQWSADAPDGSMRQACARAVGLSLPGVTFADHADFATLAVSGEAAAYIRAVGGQVTHEVYQPPLDVAGYPDCVRQCRRDFTGLEIRAGIELGDPRLHPQEAAGIVSHDFDLIVGSVHSLRRATGFADVADRYADIDDAAVFREYLAAVTTMIEDSGAFTVLAHINYAARYWPGRQGDYRSAGFEDEYRTRVRRRGGHGTDCRIRPRQRRDGTVDALLIAPVMDSAISLAWPNGGSPVRNCSGRMSDPERLVRS